MDGNRTPTIVKLNSVNVNLVYQASSITIGKNIMINWRSHSKGNYGIGEIVGNNNMILYAKTAVIDPDYIDNPDFIE